MRRTRQYLSPIAPDPDLEAPLARRDVTADGDARAVRVTTALDDVSRHLRLNPLAQVRDDTGPRRALSQPGHVTRTS